MLSKKGNNKGFTLVELIVAMSIFSIVIFMGYKVVNGTSRATQHQAGVFNEQQAANLVNKYLTKDLELCKSIESLEGTDLDKYRNDYTRFYGYKIVDSQGKRVDYVVGIKDNSYDLLRVNDSSSLPIIENLKMKDGSTQPFTINTEMDSSTTLDSGDGTKNRNLYTVNISNLDNTFEFKVNPRYTTTSGLDGGEGGEQLNGEGHIIVHKTSTDKSVIINSSDEKGQYSQEIKVSRNNDGKTTSISMKNYEFKIVIDSYISGNVSGSIDVNNSIKEFEDINIGRGASRFDHEGLIITLRKEEYKDKDDDDDDDLIVQIKKGNEILVELEKDYDDNDIDVELYNDEIDIEIEDDGEVEIEIGDKDSSKVTTYSDDNEIEIEIAKKYIANIFGIVVEGKQIDLEKIELDEKDCGSTSYIEFNPNQFKKLDLEIETKKSNESETMVITKFSSIKEDRPIEQIYGDIKIERIGKNNKQQYLEITYADGRIENVDIGSPKGQYALNIEVSTNPTRKETKIKLLPTTKVITIRTDKEAKLAEVICGNSNNIKEIELNKTAKFSTLYLNSGSGSTKNDEAIIKIRGN